MSLFWRTFSLLALLLALGVFSWLQAFQAMEMQPRALQRAHQVAGLVNLARAALREAPPSERPALLRAIDRSGQTIVRPRLPADSLQPFESDRFTRLVAQELRSQVGREVTLAGNVNGVPGLWVDFAIDSERYWLLAAPAPQASGAPGSMLLWVGVALLATLIGSIGIARLINRPLKQLSFAASRLREGYLDSRLPESPMTSEIREVNQGFNRMARELARMDEDRAVMLAGISHDLRTPLARLRLEAEMSVKYNEARANMAADIEQIDAIIGKFMDYARAHELTMKPVLVAALVDRESAGFRDRRQIRIESRVAIDLKVLADEVELGRVFLNLLENARRYGRAGADSPARVEISSSRQGPWAEIVVRDHGPGVPPDKLAQLTTPFFRGDAARTAASGAGLGLAVVDRAISAMGGTLQFENVATGGLQARIRLKRVP